MKPWQKIILIIIILIGFFIRIYKINDIPYGLLPDEASIGYNAFSILKTGKDEYGIKFPLTFKAFGDEKLPLYIYLTIPFIKIFGLNNFSIKLLSILSGTLLIFIIFKLIILLGFSFINASIAAIIIAISPATIILSRFSYESNLGLLFFTIGIYFLIKNNSKINLILSLFFLSLTFFSYITYRIISPIISLLIILIIKKNFKKAVIYSIIFTILFLILFFKSNNSNFTRFKQITSTTFLGLILEINENRNFCSYYLPKEICYINANKIVFYSRDFFYKFIKLFSFEYLFLSGDHESKYINIDHFGLLPIIFFPFYIFFIVKIINNIIYRKINNIDKLILIGFLITPLPNLLVSDPQKIRLSGLIPFLIIAIIYGLDFFIKTIKNKNYQKIVYVFLYVISILYLIFLTINFLFIHINKYEINYYSHVRRLIEFIKTKNKNSEFFIRVYQEIPIIYAFYTQTEPKIFQEKAKRKKTDFIGASHVEKINNINMIEKNIDEIYCYLKNNKMFNKDKKYFYITNENLVDNKKILKSEKIIYSKDKALRLIYIYNINEINVNFINCNFL